LHLFFIVLWFVNLTQESAFESFHAILKPALQESFFITAGKIERISVVLCA
jgi:hypothetical protein